MGMREIGMREREIGMRERERDGNEIDIGMRAIGMREIGMRER